MDVANELISELESQSEEMNAKDEEIDLLTQQFDEGRRPQESHFVIKSGIFVTILYIFGGFSKNNCTFAP